MVVGKLKSWLSVVATSLPSGEKATARIHVLAPATRNRTIRFLRSKITKSRKRPPANSRPSGEKATGARSTEREEERLVLTSQRCRPPLPTYNKCWPPGEKRTF